MRRTVRGVLKSARFQISATTVAAITAAIVAFAAGYDIQLDYDTIAILIGLLSVAAGNIAKGLIESEGQRPIGLDVPTTTKAKMAAEPKPVAKTDPERIADLERRMAEMEKFWKVGK